MKQAPAFSLPDQDGNMHSLSDYAGKWLVLYFYPKDETPGCTTEACNFRDGREAIAKVGDNIEVVGVSKDSVKSHRKFITNHSLNFTLLSDEGHKTIKAYDAWGILGTKRITVIISPTGEIARTYKNVNPETHVGEIITDLAELLKQQA
jgi:peroxiredoxin Q/BCP